MEMHGMLYTNLFDLQTKLIIQYFLIIQWEKHSTKTNTYMEALKNIICLLATYLLSWLIFRKSIQKHKLFKFKVLVRATSNVNQIFMAMCVGFF